MASSSDVNLHTLSLSLGRRLAKRAGPGHLPKLAIVLGSGFQSLSERIDRRWAIPYSELPGLHRSRVPGHAGEWICGELEGLPLWVLSGRCHYYEGHDLDAVTFPIRVLAAAGTTTLVLTNAAGGIRKGFQPGDFMRLTDHINGMGANPLRGPWPSGDPPFQDLTQTYDPGLGRLLDRAARASRVRCHRGVYMGVSGPSYETPAEIRAFRTLGADAVGMSTVPEAIVARSLGLRVAAISCITNCAASVSGRPLSHAEVLAQGRSVAQRAQRLLVRFLKSV
ncbi:MAG: purine-nucleoside phosphorylase [Verrucomicrobia bacterium]|nr:purine-nucleoside phosphorylase [Verrucomicrobiota bacterium]MBI3870352.1 purine-nucleoside phosphorylase [Verrucomicrobiota bacterium]